MKQQIMFDLDDTLIYCNRYFFHVVDQFIETITSWFHPFPSVHALAVRDKQNELDLTLIEQSGFRSEHFPRSFVETYRYFSHLTGRECSKQEMEKLWELGIQVYSHDTEPYPHMEQTLTQLVTAGHELHLYTGGEAKIQTRKIEQMNLKRFFENRIYIRQLKNNDALESILQDGRFDRRHTWMIGNSIRTDVVPALTAGIHAIHMQTKEEWEYNNIPIDIKPTSAFFRLQQLKEIPITISQFLAQ
ncbi:HAD family hydrolase [Paenibacillus yanchengensis]|uniref:HAD family hydrolase n=1 Tax=Paenibacillus yanchengensis TaxID=2035833 RepID=A0ABW4YPY8_9BACL